MLRLHLSRRRTDDGELSVRSSLACGFDTDKRVTLAGTVKGDLLRHRTVQVWLARAFDQQPQAYSEFAADHPQDAGGRADDPVGPDVMEARVEGSCEVQ
jgi:hypothetical protein